jgi:AcrR family transcriptional regulator
MTGKRPIDRLPQCSAGGAEGERLSRDTVDLTRRELILEAAEEVFAELGYRQTNDEDILAAAGIPGDTLHPYFADKEACFLGVLDRAAAVGHAEMAAAIRGQKGWGRQTYAAVRVLLGRVVAGSTDMRIVLVEAPGAGPAAVTRYEGLGEAGVAWLARGRWQHPAAADLPDCFERLVVDGVTFLLRRCLLDSPGPTMPQLLPELGRYTIEPFVGPVEFSRLVSEFGD